MAAPGPLGSLEDFFEMPSDLEIVYAIMNNGYRINLAQLMKSGRWDIANAIIGNPLADVTALDESDVAPLHRTIDQNRTQIFQALLVNPKIDVNIKNRHGQTVLRMAICDGHTEIADLLRAHGAHE